MFKNWCGQSGGRTQKLTLSEELIDGRTDFMHIDKNSQRFKVDEIFFGWSWSKMGVASLIMGL